MKGRLSESEKSYQIAFVSLFTFSLMTLAIGLLNVFFMGNEGRQCLPYFLASTSIFYFACAMAAFANQEIVLAWTPKILSFLINKLRGNAATNESHRAAMAFRTLGLVHLTLCLALLFLTFKVSLSA